MATKYKHKKTGDIVKSVDKWYEVIGSTLNIPAKYIEGCSDWEPVQDSLYEIVAYKMVRADQVYTKTKPNHWASSIFMTGLRTMGDEEMKIMYETGGTTIHSVKILSTQEVITVGDKVTWEYGSGPHIITKLYLQDGQMGVDVEDEDGTTDDYWLKDLVKRNLRKYTEPVVICTTEDGKSVTDPHQLVYVVNDYTWNKVEVYAKEANQYRTWRVFSSDTARREYILMNKPVLSYTDVWKAWQSAEDNRVWNDMKIKELVQEKLKQQ